MILTVSQLNESVNGIFSELGITGGLSVRGEVSGYKKHSSGHIYFTLKDESASVRCAFFKPYSLECKFEIENGMMVTVSGGVKIYERDGQYQFVVYSVSEDGKGALQLRFEELKRKLEEEGLFDNAHKKAIPAYSKKLGVVTSPTGAVIKDIKNVATRRCPNVSILLAPVTVQGDDAPRSICAGIRALDERDDIDVIIVGRGGGSMEDLWCFNDEAVVRAIFECRTPIISAVGHETDFTLSDFAADMRAPTPSAAAELAVFEYNAMVQDIDYFERLLVRRIDGDIINCSLKLKQLEKSLHDPSAIFDNFNLRIDAMLEKLLLKCDRSDDEERLMRLADKLDALSPLKILKRGYTVTKNKNGDIIKKCSEAKIEKEIFVMFHDGEIKAEVKNEEN